jgi:hypothetical protein
MLKKGYMATLVAIAGFAAALPAASASGSGDTKAKRPGQLSVGVSVLKFAAAGKTITATGLVTGTLNDGAGHLSTVKQKVKLTATTGGRCQVLHLFLDQLNLQLLGLNAHLDQVTLDVTGQRTGGPLGSLFCRLARAKLASTRASTVGALNAGVQRHRMNALRFNAEVFPKATATQAQPSCQVLDLVVGPLNLRLLGLVVDLKKVHLAVTATRGQGKLGDLFCDLADNNQSGSTTTTTTTTAQ